MTINEATTGSGTQESLSKEDITLFFIDSETVGARWTGRPEVTSRRPWTQFWPPGPGSDLYQWLRVHVPEAISWRFDPSNPFDRPWQKWTQAAREAGTHIPSITLLPSELKTRSDPGKIGHEAIEGVQRPLLASLDRKLEEWKLPFITPNAFTYLSNQELYATQKPYHTRLPFPSSFSRKNIVGQAYNSVNVHVVNGFEQHFTLPISGFEFRNIPSKIENWDAESVRNEYLPQMEGWLQEHFNASLVHIYTFTFRSLDSSRKPADAWIAPFARAHCDVTPNSAKSRLQLHTPALANELRNKRYRFIGLWRPITYPEQDCTLAMCDFRSIHPADLIPVDVLFPHFCDEGYELRYNPNHRWFYKRGIAKDEVIILKHYDSSDNEANTCPHAAFYDPTVSPNTPERASIEIRAIVVD